MGLGGFFFFLPTHILTRTHHINLYHYIEQCKKFSSLNAALIYNKFFSNYIVSSKAMSYQYQVSGVRNSLLFIKLIQVSFKIAMHYAVSPSTRFFRSQDVWDNCSSTV
jgi:hypothetical protein